MAARLVMGIMGYGALYILEISEHISGYTLPFKSMDARIRLLSRRILKEGEGANFREELTVTFGDTRHPC